MLLPPFSGKHRENSGVAVTADAITRLIYIWNSKITEKATV